MRLVSSLAVVAGCLVASSAAAQQQQQQQPDTIFKDIEYVGGSAALKDEQKGILVVSTTEVKLVDKKGTAYLTIPVASIRDAQDSNFSGQKKSDLKSSAVGAVAQVPDFLKKVKTGGQLTITTGGDSAAAESIVFQTSEEGVPEKVTAVILSRLPREVLAAAAAAHRQRDKIFTDVEYVKGSAALKDKEKGTLIVTTTEVRLVDKKQKDKVYLTIPVASIREARDALFNKGGGSGSGVSGIPKVPGFLKKAKPAGQIIVNTGHDSAAAKESIIFQSTDPGTVRAVAAAIRSRLPGATQEDADLAARAEADANAEAAANAAANEPPPLMIVANPYTEVEADSAAAVEVGTVVRDDISKFLGDKVQILTRQQMNSALEPYGYPADAILSQSLAVTLAKELNAAVLITGEMKKESDGKYTVTASLGTADKPNGTPVTMTQNAGESITDFGHRLAEGLKGPQQPTP